MRIAMVVGEHSGDTLGADLLKILQARYPDCEFVGIGGPKMLELGFHSLFPMERLAVMGLFEVLSRLRELLGIRRKLVEYFRQNPPDVFIGIDAPDFNIHLAFLLKQYQIKTVHYVSPSVWAWRQNRIKKIKRSIDLMLTLFPFEAEFYQQHAMHVTFVGHPLADQFALHHDKTAACAELGLDPQKPVLAILPGSRGLELKYNAHTFVKAAMLCQAKMPDLQCVVPFVNEKRRQEFLLTMQHLNCQLPITQVDGKARIVMAASDAILLASGTATLEGALVKRPMVVSYRMSALSFAIIRRLVKVPYVALPNLLLKRVIVPELLQNAATPEAIATQLLRMLNDASYQQTLQQDFEQIHRQLKQNASQKAADAIEHLIQDKR